MDTKGGSWYLGTADAIYQNLEFIDMYDPEYVLILSGDHIYKMDYSLMLKYAKKKEADLAIAVMEVDWNEASRFGITNVDEDMKIVEFDEKPENPKNNMASMGIYIFKWSILREALVKDAKNENSDHDFGKNVIPMLLNEGKSIYSYLYNGYWRDVGTIDSYYKANMDLLEENSEFDLFSNDLRVYSNNKTWRPHYMGQEADVNNSLVCDGCTVNGYVSNSVLSYNVTIGKNSTVRDSIIFNNAVIEDGAVVEKAIIGENMRIVKGSRIGSVKNDEVTVIA